MSSASFFVRVQSLALYKKMLSMYALEDSDFVFDGQLAVEGDLQFY